MHKTFCIAWLGMILVSSRPGYTAEPIKVAVIPSVLNLFIQQSILEGTLKDEPGLFERTLELLHQGLSLQPGFALSSKQWANDDEAATQFMLSVPYPNRREEHDADILILIGKADGERKAVEIFLVAVETGRGISSFLDLQNVSALTLPKFLLERVLKGLTYAPELLAIGADRIIDPPHSVVQYQCSGRLGEKIFIQVDYDDTHEEIEHTLILLGEKREEDRYTVELPAKDNHFITLTYVLQDGVLQRVDIDTDFGPRDLETTTPIPVTAVSTGGHEIDFLFTWDANGKPAVSVAPRINPYHPHLLRNF